MTIDINHFKQKLEDELKSLEAELPKVARKNPDNPADWEPKPAEHEALAADDNIIADNVEDYVDNAAVVGSLETRYQDVKAALGKITKGTYGMCEVCGKEIELDRLEANPAARTCKEHLS